MIVYYQLTPPCCWDNATAFAEIGNFEDKSQDEIANEETVVEAAEANNEEKENSEEFGDHLDK